MYKEIFSNMLKKARIEAGYTQEEIAKILGISQITISRYEKGTREPDIETLGKLIDFYEIDANRLLGTGLTKK